MVKKAPSFNPTLTFLEYQDQDISSGMLACKATDGIVLNSVKP